MQFIFVDMIIIYHLSNPFTQNHTTYYTYSTLPVKQNSERNKVAVMSAMQQQDFKKFFNHP